MEADPKVTTGPGASSGGAPQPDQPTESIARDLLKGRYLLGPELGRGGFAITYLAADLEVASRKVVVKVLNEARSGDSWSLKKFRSEMEALARIDHPNVVSVIDFGQREDGKPFLVMQYVAGETLRKIIPRQGLPLAQVAQIIKQTGRALSAAHAVGVCHRDLKPENIMVQSDSHGEDQIKLIDFGVATIQEQDSHSQSSTSAGTHAYMAPEQFEGRSSVATDIYQMGVLAYELVTGIVPFRATTPGGLALQKMEPVKVPPADLRLDLPEAAQEIILKALSINPQDRFPRARDFGDALAAALASGDLEPVQWTKSDARRRSSARSQLAAPRIRSRPAWIYAALIIAVLVLAGAVYFLTRGISRRADSVAVLPFQNQTGDPQLAFLTEGITESLVNDLSRIPTLRVSARASVLKYSGTNVDPRVAGRELGVSRVVTGSVARAGDTFVFYAELIDVASGDRLWGNNYTGKMSSLADVLQQFSTEVTDQLRLKLSRPLKERLKRQYALGSAAYEQYLKGRFYLNKRWTHSDFEQAIDHFTQAISADPNYAPAYAGIADAYAIMARYGPYDAGTQPEFALQKARAAAEHALQLDGTLAEAYHALAQVEMQADYRWKAAEGNFLRSLELNPNWAEAHESYALELAALGRFDEALRQLKTAEDLEPGNFNFQIARGLVLYLARRNDESLASLEHLPKNLLREAAVTQIVALDYWAKSMPADALAAVKRLPETTPAQLRIPLSVVAYAQAGQTAKAREILASYLGRSEALWWYYLALAHMSLHETDEAIHNLETAHEQRWDEIIFIGVDPMLDALRTNPRFRALLKSTNLENEYLTH